jgi:hypothetical protein
MKNDANVPSKRSLRSLTKRAGSGSQRHDPEDPDPHPDPY